MSAIVIAPNATSHARRSLRLARSAIVSSKLTDCAIVSSIFLLDEFFFSIGEYPFLPSCCWPANSLGAGGRGGWRCCASDVFGRGVRIAGGGRSDFDAPRIGRHGNPLHRKDGVESRDGVVDIRRADARDRLMERDIEAELVRQFSAESLAQRASIVL